MVTSGLPNIRFGLLLIEEEKGKAHSSLMKAPLRFITCFPRRLLCFLEAKSNALLVAGREQYINRLSFSIPTFSYSGLAASLTNLDNAKKRLTRKWVERDLAAFVYLVNCYYVQSFRGVNNLYSTAASYKFRM